MRRGRRLDIGRGGGDDDLGGRSGLDLLRVELVAGELQGRFGPLERGAGRGGPVRVVEVGLVLGLGGLSRHPDGTLALDGHVVALDRASGPERFQGVQEDDPHRIIDRHRGHVEGDALERADVADGPQDLRIPLRREAVVRGLLEADFLFPPALEAVADDEGGLVGHDSPSLPLSGTSMSCMKVSDLARAGALRSIMKSL